MTKRKKRLLTLILAVLYTLSSTMFSVYAAEDELPVAGTASYEESADEAAEETTEEVTEEEESSAEETGTEAEEISEETETEEISEEEESVTEEVSEETETETEEISEDTETEAEEVSEETETEAEKISEETETETEEVSEETETEEISEEEESVTEEVAEETETETEEISEETETEEISEEEESLTEEVSEETETEAEEVSEETDTEEVSEEEESLTEEVSEETETEAEEISEETETEAEEISEETETETASEEIEETKTTEDSRNDSEPADSEDFIREPDAEIQENPIAATIVVGSSYEAEIQNPGDYVYYKFIPAEDGVYIFESNAGSDTYGYLYDAEWNVLAYNDDDGEGSNFRISRKLNKGVTYYYGVRFYSSGNTGIIPVSLSQIQTGWNQIGDDMYYIDSDGNYCTGKTTIDGKDYLFDSSGRLVRNNYAWGKDSYYYYAGADGVVITKTGWVQNEYGTYYYVNDDKGHLAEGWKKLSDNWYYFSPGMYHSSAYTIYNSDDEPFVYLFRENGVLVTAVGWIQFDGRWYYVKKSSGELQTGLADIGGNKYYFHTYYGYMYSNTVVEVDGITYLADGSGHLTEAKAGWNKIGEYYFYLKDGEFVKSQVLQLDSYFYGFNSSGQMYDDSTFYLNGSYYRARKGGKLYAKTWYQEDATWYYYGEGGKAASGVTTVGEKQYYFRDTGLMVTYEVVSDSENVYYAEASGVLRKLSAGWNLIDFGTYSGYYYIKDGSYYRNGVYEIGTAFYGFNYSGQMYDNMAFSLNGSYYRAREGGKLYVNAWYQAGGSWYYYGEGGKAPSGVTTVSGKKYLFAVEGRMVTDGVGTDGTNVYYADQKGNLTQLSAGWNQINGVYYYVKDGAFLTYTVVKLGGAYYGFNDAGQMFDNEAFIFNGNYYRAKDGGQLYQSAWYKDGASWYYYGDDGKAAQGFRTIGGKKYYFNNDGAMLVNGAVTDYNGTPAAYYADDSGSLAQMPEGWNKKGATYFYVKNGVILTGLQKIGSSRYGFDSDGRMYDDTAFSISYNCRGRAKKGGALYVNEWYQEGSDWYYYGEEGRSAFGLTKIGSKSYYFDAEGKMRKETTYSASDAIYYFGSDGVAVKMAEGWNNCDGSYYYVADGKLVRDEIRKIGNYYYGFDYNGLMFDDTAFSHYEEYFNYYYRAKKGGKLYEKEWVQIGQEWYFYGTAGKAPDGFASVGGKQYLFSYGRMRKDYAFIYENKPYYADENGVVSPVSKTGLFRTSEYGSSGALYYLSNGEIVTSSWQNIDGKYYYFSVTGAAYTNTAGVKIGNKLYAFDSEGRMFSGCWVRLSNGYIGYAESSGALAVGEKKIGSKYYYFEEVAGHLLTGLVTYNGKTYLCGSDGAYIGTAKGNGWNEIKGSWYYIVNNQPVKGRYAVDGVYYYFDYNGCMQKDQLIDSRVYGANGKQVASGWYQLNGRYVYINKQGRYVNGIQVINGKEYYFENGFMWVGELIIGNEKRIYGAGGALISTETMKNGWVLANGVYYYYKDGRPYTGWVGAYYIRNGIMLRNQEVDGYWLGQDGQYVKSGWVKLSSSSYKPGAYTGYYGYAKSNGKLARDEWLQLSGNRYYFSGIRMVTGIQVVDGKVYQFSDTGVQTSVLLDKVKDGWLKVGTEYAFINNGMVMKSNTLKIGNDEYAFDSKGFMIRNAFSGSYADYYIYKYSYYGSDGKKAEYTGWKKLFGNWYYFDSSHCLVFGFKVIDGKQYYFNYDMVTSWAVDDRHLYEFGSDGVLTGQNTTQNGWVNKDGLWFYFRDGYAASGVQTVDGKVYAFGSSMIKNATFYNNGAYYFFGSDGVLAAKEGWKTDSEGYRYYTDATGRALTGIRKIDGKTCYFDDYGRQIP